MPSPLSINNINPCISLAETLLELSNSYVFCFVATGQLPVLTPTPTDLPKMVGRQMVPCIDNSVVYGGEAIVYLPCGIYSLPLKWIVNIATKGSSQHGRVSVGHSAIVVRLSEGWTACVHALVFSTSSNVQRNVVVCVHIRVSECTLRCIYYLPY